jgi:hypothetical protein
MLRCVTCKDDISEERMASIIRAESQVFLRSMLQLLVTANVLSSLILFSLLM